MFRTRKRVFIFCNGCTRRSLDSSRLVEYFKANNFNITDYPEAADLIIFVTCGFSHKEAESLEMIKKFNNYKAELIIAGCLPDMSPRFKEIFKGRYIETRNLENIDTVFKGFQTNFSKIPDGHSTHLILRSNLFLHFFYRFNLSKQFLKKCLQFLWRRLKIGKKNNEERRGPFLRISNGCFERCSYCSIWKAIGGLRSKSVEECISEYKTLLQNGHRYIAFIADNLGSYGLDIGTNFPSLLESLSNVDRSLNVSWRFEEMHPRWVMKYQDTLIKIIAEGKLKEIICPIQSGNNRILKLMNRHHTIEEITDVLLNFKKINKNLKIYTHTLIGFPSETEDDFLDTLLAVKKVKFDLVYIFPYYDGLGSLASEMPGKLSESEIKKRVDRAQRFFKDEGIEIGFFGGQQL